MMFKFRQGSIQRIRAAKARPPKNGRWRSKLALVMLLPVMVLMTACGAADDVGKVVANSGDDFAKAALNSTDDLAKAAGNSGDDIAKIALSSGDDIAKVAVNSTDDVAEALAPLMNDVPALAPVVAPAIEQRALAVFIASTDDQYQRLASRWDELNPELKDFLEDTFVQNSCQAVLSYLSYEEVSVSGIATSVGLDLVGIGLDIDEDEFAGVVYAVFQETVDTLKQDNYEGEESLTEWCEVFEN